VPIKVAATVTTSDREYPKSSTLHCSWASQNCFFATGVETNQVQDALYGVNRITGATLFKHELPAGIYIDNMNFDYLTDTLYSVAFDANTRQARIVGWEGTDGNVTGIWDITADLRGAFVFGGAVTYCSTTKTMFIGLDNGNFADGIFQDRVAVFSLAGVPATRPQLVDDFPLLFPVPSSFRAFCNATAVEALIGVTVQADSEAREKVLVGNVVAAGRDGLFVPLSRADLPTFGQRGERALFLNGMASEFGGQMLIPTYTPFQIGPGTPPVQGFLWTVQPFVAPAPGTSIITPLGYYLAGAAGVPTV
jgi:hypothetical protein